MLEILTGDYLYGTLGFKRLIMKDIIYCPFIVHNDNVEINFLLIYDEFSFCVFSNSLNELSDKDKDHIDVESELQSDIIFYV